MRSSRAVALAAAVILSVTLTEAASNLHEASAGQDCAVVLGEKNAREENPETSQVKEAVGKRLDDKFTAYTGQNRFGQLERGYIGAIPTEADRLVVVVDSEKVDLASTQRELDEVEAKERDNVATTPQVRVEVVASCFPADGLIDAQRVIETRKWHPRAGEVLYGWYLNPTDSRFHVSFAERDGDVAAALKTELGDRVELNNDVPRPADGAGTLRRGDVAPHFGSSSIRRVAVTNDDTACTVGPTVRFTASNPAGAAGARGLLAAGHCYNDGDELESANIAFGTAYEDLLTGPSHDGLIISGTAPRGTNYATDNIWANGRQVLNSTPSGTDPGPLEELFARDVEGQFNLSSTDVTTEMCISGRVSGNTCDAVALNGNVNSCFPLATGEGCVFNYFVLSHPTNLQLGEGGDSGGPVYVCLNGAGDVIDTGAHGGRWCNGEGSGGGAVPDPADKRRVKIVGIVSFDLDGGRLGISRISEIRSFIPYFEIADFD